MKIELHQFYLSRGGGTVYIFDEQDGDTIYGSAWQGKRNYRVHMNTKSDLNQSITPITPEIAKLALFSQDEKP